MTMLSRTRGLDAVDGTRGVAVQLRRRTVRGRRDEPLKVLSLFGTRPEAIKMAPVVQELERRSHLGTIESRVCVTGQHRELLDQVLSLFRIRPDYDLDVMSHDQTPASAAAAILRMVEPVLKTERPDWVLVQGDTTTAAMGALAGFYAGCRVAHVEAGLRTDHSREPFPEEINRRLADSLADLHFAPTSLAAENLVRESVPPDRIVVTGNTGIDALYAVASRSPPADLDTILDSGPAEPPDGRRLLLLTAHRRESFGEPLEQVCRAARDLAQQRSVPLRIVYPVHMNPRVCRPVHRLLCGVEGVVLTPPVDYATFVHLMKRADLVLTDSGGIQEEAPSLGVPVLLLRDRTERPEGVAAGAVALVGTRRRRIVRKTLRLLTDPAAYAAMAAVRSPYGDGRAAGRIVSALLGERVEPFRAESPVLPQRSPLHARRAITPTS